MKKGQYSEAEKQKIVKEYGAIKIWGGKARLLKKYNVSARTYYDWKNPERKHARNFLRVWKNRDKIMNHRQPVCAFMNKSGQCKNQNLVAGNKKSVKCIGKHCLNYKPLPFIPENIPIISMKKIKGGKDDRRNR